MFKKSFQRKTFFCSICGRPLFSYEEENIPGEQPKIYQHYPPAKILYVATDEEDRYVCMEHLLALAVLEEILCTPSEEVYEDEDATKILLDWLYAVGLLSKGPFESLLLARIREALALYYTNKLSSQSASIQSSLVLDFASIISKLEERKKRARNDIIRQKYAERIVKVKICFIILDLAFQKLKELSASEFFQCSVLPFLVDRGKKRIVIPPPVINKLIWERIALGFKELILEKMLYRLIGLFLTSIWVWNPYLLPAIMPQVQNEYKEWIDNDFKLLVKKIIRRFTRHPFDLFAAVNRAINDNKIEDIYVPHPAVSDPLVPDVFRNIRELRQKYPHLSGNSAIVKLKGISLEDLQKYLKDIGMSRARDLDSLGLLRYLIRLSEAKLIEPATGFFVLLNWDIFKNLYRAFNRYLSRYHYRYII